MQATPSRSSTPYPCSTIAPVTARSAGVWLRSATTWRSPQDGAEWLVPIDSKVTHIGRGLTSHVRLEEQRVSRSHAILVRHGHHTRLLDNRSANGTFVNGRRIIATNITDGDVIRIGPVVMTYLQVA